MGKKLAILGHSTRGKDVIELLEMLGGVNGKINRKTGETYNIYNGRYFIDEICNIREVAYYIDFESQIRCIDIKDITTNFIVYSLEMFLKTFPFKVWDKVFLYDNITEGCVTGMKWDEDKGTVKYCVYTSAECWCDVKELLKWNAEFLVNKEKNKEVDKMFFSHLHRNHLENVLSELYEHIKTTPKEELEREFEEIKEWSNVGPTVEEFMTFCECVNKKLKYPDNYDECVRIAKNIHGYDIHIDTPAYRELMESFVKLLICRDAYWKIAGDEMGLDKPWEPKFGKTILFDITFYLYQDNLVLHKGEYPSSDICILAFPTEDMRDAFYENFKDLIEQCKELL